MFSKLVCISNVYPTVNVWLYACIAYTLRRFVVVVRPSVIVEVLTAGMWE